VPGKRRIAETASERLRYVGPYSFAPDVRNVALTIAIQSPAEEEAARRFCWNLLARKNGLLTAARPLYADWKNLLVWNKTNAGQGSFYRSKHELIAVFKNHHARVKRIPSTRVSTRSGRDTHTMGIFTIAIMAALIVAFVFFCMRR
jgi:hypothetical protein